MIFKTDRLTVTTWQPPDVAELAKIHADRDAMAHMVSGTQTQAETQARIEHWIAEHRARGWSKWRVADSHEQLIGRAGFTRDHATPRRQAGYLLAREQWGQGYATELLIALARWHQENPDPTLSEPLTASVFADNIASRRVLEKAGFTLTDTITENHLLLLYTLPIGSGRRGSVP